MADTAAGVMIDTICDWGVDHVFGLPGDGINGIMEALRVRQDKIRFVQVRHEEAAAFMACAWAKYTGKLGVCLATSGPGGIHLLNGLYDAKLDQQPVLALTGMQFHDLIDTYTQQDVALDRLFEDVAKYNVRIMGPAHVRNATDLACRTALTYHGVSHITIPIDFQYESMSSERRSTRNVPDHTSAIRAYGGMVPSGEALRKAAEILNAGKKIAILAGRGALDATDELEKVAEILGAPIIKALLGKAAVPDDSPYTTGGIGLLGTRPSQDAFEECDTLLIVGSSFPYINFLPKPGQARGVQIELDPMRVGLRYPVEVGLVGDSKKTLLELIPLLKRNEDRSFLTKAQERMKEWWKVMDERASKMDKPMKPQVIAAELNKQLADNAIVSCDSGTITTWWARHVIARRGQMHSLSGTLASMACGLPYTNAAQIAYPGRQCVGIMGDGAFAMIMMELITSVKYQLPVKILVFKNNALGQIKWEQMVLEGNPEFGIQLQPIDFAGFAHVCGGAGYTIEDPKDAGDVMREAMRNPGPTVIQAVVDQLEPPLPPKVTLKEAKHFAESLVRGEPEGAEIALTALKEKVREIV